MRLGFVMPTRVDNPEREEWRKFSLSSLSRTPVSDPLPVLLFVEKFPSFDLTFLSNFRGFFATSVPEPPDSHSACSALAYGYDCLFDAFTNVTHCCFLADDFIYNPQWLEQLQSLILRHPDAKGWSVYRSSNTRWHRTLRVEGEDHLVTSISGPGAMTREEWFAWGVNHHSFPRLDCLTLDIAHPKDRPGERWVTERSYIQQIGLRGAHNYAGECDTALDFLEDG